MTEAVLPPVHIPLARPDIRPEDWARAQAVIESGLLVQGDNVLAFESALADFTGVPYTAAVSSGTAALHLALLAYGIGAGDAVICPAFTFPATANVVELVNARTVLCDVDPTRYVMTPAEVQAAIESYQGKERLRAVMLVHEFGYPADAAGIRRVCDEYKLLLIEDSACALGTKANGLHVGHHAHASCFSFHPRKAITTGEGGAVISANPEFMARVRTYRNHGIVTGVEDMPGGMDFVLAGLNYRLTDFQAALALGPLQRFEEELQRRQELALIYSEELSSFDSLRLPEVPDGHSLQSFMVVLPSHIQRQELIQQLRADGVQANLGAQALHCLSYYRQRYGWEATDFATAAELYHHGLVLPLYGSLTSDEIRWVAQRVKYHASTIG